MTMLSHIPVPGPPPDLAVTCGRWADERSAEEELATFLEATGLFGVHRQVPGRPLWTHYFQQKQDVRADLLLVPTHRLIELGWRAGVVVIEVKRSGEKIGPGCSQLIDYLNSAWRLPECGGITVVPAFGFLFPAHKQHGPLASVMAHQHIGTACFNAGGLACHCGENRVLSISATGELRLGRLNFGLKVGSR